MPKKKTTFDNRDIDARQKSGATARNTANFPSFLASRMPKVITAESTSGIILKPVENREEELVVDKSSTLEIDDTDSKEALGVIDKFCCSSVSTLSLWRSLEPLRKRRQLNFVTQIVHLVEEKATVTILERLKTCFVSPDAEGFASGQNIIVVIDWFVVYKLAYINFNINAFFVCKM